MSTIIGIDPGASGGIAIDNGQEVRALKLADLTPQDLYRLLAEHEPATVVLELVAATPQMGTVSAFSFGQTYGRIEMAVIAAGLRIERVRPQAWQKALGLPKVGGGIGKNDTAKKNRNKAKAQELFPAIKCTHATADALLLCYFGRKTLQGAA